MHASPDSDAELDTGTTVVGIVADPDETTDAGDADAGSGPVAGRGVDAGESAPRDGDVDGDVSAPRDGGAVDLDLPDTDGPAVVIATDRRASLGTMVSSKSARKIEPLGDRAAMGFSGSVSGAAALARRLRSSLSLYETRRGRPMSAEAVGSLVGNTLRETPMGVSPMVGAVDEEARLFAFDPGGGRTEAGYAAVGSGSPYAYGHLEAAYQPGLTVAAAARVALEAVDVAVERDTASGNGLNLAVVTADGVETWTRESLPSGS